MAQKVDGVWIEKEQVVSNFGKGVVLSGDFTPAAEVYDVPDVTENAGHLGGDALLIGGYVADARGTPGQERW